MLTTLFPFVYSAGGRRRRCDVERTLQDKKDNVKDVGLQVLLP